MYDSNRLPFVETLRVEAHRLAFGHGESEPRIDRTKRHNLLDLIFIALCAMVSGANDCVAIEKFGKTKRAWLEKFPDLPHGIPSHDTYCRVFAVVDSEAFMACFLTWVEGLQESTDCLLVAIDGKTVRATLDLAKGKIAFHLVMADGRGLGWG